MTPFLSFFRLMWTLYFFEELTPLGFLDLSKKIYRCLAIYIDTDHKKYTYFRLKQTHDIVFTIQTLTIFIYTFIYSDHKMKTITIVSLKIKMFSVLDKVLYQGVFIPPTKISEGFYTSKNKSRGFLYLHSNILGFFMCHLVTWITGVPNFIGLFLCKKNNLKRSFRL